MPAISGWSSGIAPQPIRVGITGTPSELGELHQQAEASALIDAAAGHDQRRSAAFSMAIAFSAWARVAAGL